MCPNCGKRMGVLTTRHPSKPGKGWEIGRVSPAIEWYTQDFVVRRRHCKHCTQSTFTVELPIEDIISMMQGAVDGHAPINLIKIHE